MKQNINHSKLRRLVNLIVEQEESDDVYRITPEEYLQLLDFSDNSPGFTKIKKFGGKPLYITGSLNVSRRPISTLGNVAYVDGSLDISYTKIGKLPDGIAKGHIWDSGTPIETARLRKQDAKWLAENEERRENNEWEIGKSDEANRANALFQYLIDEGEIESMDDDERESLVELKRRYARIEKEYDDSDDSDEQSELYEKLSELEEQIGELEDKNNDIYNTIVPDGHSHYGMTTFNVIPLRKGSQLRIYSVGPDSEMDKALEQYWKDYLDDSGLDNINSYIIEGCIDTDAAVEIAEEDYRNQIEDYPDNWFTNDDLELSPSQERRISELEDYITELDEYISEKSDEQTSMEFDTDDEDGYNQQQQELQELIDEAEENKTKAEEEIDVINDSKEITQSMIDEKVDDMVYQVKIDPLSYLKDMGFTIKNYVDTECILGELTSQSDYGDLTSYDGNYDTVDVDNETFYIMRTE
jgi:hypothetical protein